jgi:hypothetical protein
MPENILDIFNNDAFSVTTMLEPVNRMPTAPSFLGSLGIFTDDPVNTDTVAIGMQEGQLTLIRTTERGAPIEMQERNPRDVRSFRLPRLAKGDKLRASELQGILPWPNETQVDAVAGRVADMQQRLKQDLEYTKEYHRLGALQGVLLDADGSVIYDYFDEWDITQPADIDLNPLAATDGALRESITDVKRTLIRAAQNGGAGIRRVIGLAGDDFWDALVRSPEVRATYLNWTAASDLRNAEPFETFRYGGIDWINYQGSDDNTEIAIPANKAIVFPTGIPGMFRHIMGPGETFETVNRMGKDVYPLIVRDNDRNMWVQPEIYSYPLYLNSRPDLVLTVTV